VDALQNEGNITASPNKATITEIIKKGLSSGALADNCCDEAKFYEKVRHFCRSINAAAWRPTGDHADKSASGYTPMQVIVDGVQNYNTSMSATCDNVIVTTHTKSVMAIEHLGKKVKMSEGDGKQTSLNDLMGPVMVNVSTYGDAGSSGQHVEAAMNDDNAVAAKNNEPKTKVDHCKTHTRSVMVIDQLGKKLTRHEEDVKQRTLVDTMGPVLVNVSQHGEAGSTGQVVVKTTSVSNTNTPAEAACASEWNNNGRSTKCLHIRGPKITDATKKWVNNEVHTFVKDNETTPDKAFMVKTFNLGVELEIVDKRNSKDAIISHIKAYVKTKGLDAIINECQRDED
jgi:hypothetical protein